MLVILWRVVAGGLGSDEFNDGLAEEFDEVVDEKGNAQCLSKRYQDFVSVRHPIHPEG